MPDPQKAPRKAGTNRGETKEHIDKRARSNPHPAKQDDGKKTTSTARLRQYLANQAMTGRVDYYEGKGVRIEAPRQSIDEPRDMKGGGKRGKIKGWSKASRRRLRNTLLTFGPPEGWETYGITLTIPGPPPTPEESTALFKSYSLAIAKAGLSAVWRVEVQKRGSLHWHLIGYGPDRLPTGDRSRSVFRELWKKAIVKMGPVKFDEPYHGPQGQWQRGLTHSTSRMALPGAEGHAVDINHAGKSVGAWLRYLQDHASKAKQEQIAQNIGRHWGVIGRKHLQRVLPDFGDKLEAREYWRFLRAFQRLRTPAVKDSRAPFGSRHGYRVRKGYKGASVYFSRPETIKRLVDWATGSETP